MGGSLPGFPLVATARVGVGRGGMARGIAEHAVNGEASPSVMQPMPIIYELRPGVGKVKETGSGSRSGVLVAVSGRNKK